MSGSQQANLCQGSAMKIDEKKSGQGKVNSIRQHQPPNPAPTGRASHSQQDRTLLNIAAM